MKAAVARIHKYVRNCASDVRSCPRVLDKAAVVMSSAGRAITFLVNVGARRPLRADGDLVPNNLFLFRDVRVVNEDGVFLCRKMTSDYTIVRRDYELALREYFTLDRGVFVDVGAHIGKYTVMVARRLGNKGRVIAIEPDPDNFRMLEMNIRENHLSNVIALNVACAETNGRVTLYRDRCEPIKHSLREKRGQKVTVEARSIDSVLDEVGVREIHLFKLDAEGVETEILRGGLETLKRNQSVRIVLEAYTEEPLRLLREFGFRLERTRHRFGSDGYYYVAERNVTSHLVTHS